MDNRDNLLIASNLTSSDAKLNRLLAEFDFEEYEIKAICLMLDLVENQNQFYGLPICLSS